MAQLIETHAEGMLAQGRGETLRHWIDELPSELLGRHPWILYWAAASQAQLAPREARQLYEKAFEQFRAQGASGEAGMILACSGAMDAILYELDDFSHLDRWIAVLDDAAQRGVRFPSAAVEARVACNMVVSLTLRQPQRHDIGRWVEQSLTSARNSADRNLQMFVGLLCALTLVWTGLYSRARQLIDAANRMSADPAITPFSRITL
jgi:ATP/maltotriose-dependent transcriptional regulator MalT